MAYQTKCPLNALRHDHGPSCHRPQSLLEEVSISTCKCFYVEFSLLTALFSLGFLAGLLVTMSSVQDS